MITRQSTPLFTRAAGRDPATSPRPPVLAKGTHSEVAKRTFSLASFGAAFLAGDIFVVFPEAVDLLREAVFLFVEVPVLLAAAFFLLEALVPAAFFPETLVSVSLVSSVFLLISFFPFAFSAIIILLSHEEYYGSLCPLSNENCAICS